MSLTSKDAFERELRKLMHEDIENIKDDMSVGSLPDHGAYRERCGQIVGLRKLLNLIDIANTNLEKQR